MPPNNGLSSSRNRSGLSRERQHTVPFVAPSKSTYSRRCDSGHAEDCFARATSLSSTYRKCCCSYGPTVVHRVGAVSLFTLCSCYSHAEHARVHPAHVFCQERPSLLSSFFHQNSCMASSLVCYRHHCPVLSFNITQARARVAGVSCIRDEKRPYRGWFAVCNVSIEDSSH